MHELPRLWRTLDEAGVLAGVEAQWLEWLGDELDLVRPFLRPEQQLAASYPCENPGGDGCPRRVVVHGDDDIVAVCGCSPRECDPLTLRRRDIVVYDFDVLALSRAIASVLGLGDDGRVTAGDVAGIYRLGALSYGAGQRAAVMLALHCGADDGQHPLERFLAEHDGQPTLLVVPVPLDHVRSQVAEHRGVVLAACSDLLAIDGQHLVLRQDRDGFLGDLQAQLARRVAPLAFQVREAPSAYRYGRETAAAGMDYSEAEKLREANGLDELDVAEADGFVPIGLLRRRGKRVPIVWIAPTPHIETVSIGIRARLKEDGLFVVMPNRPNTTAQMLANSIVLVQLRDGADLPLCAALDALDPRYREERVDKKDALFDDVEVELAHEPGVRHVVRINGVEAFGFASSNLKFLRLLVLAAQRRSEPDADGGGWISKTRLEGDERDREVDDLRKALATAEHTEHLSAAELRALIKASPNRNGTIRLAVDPRRVRIDESLTGFRLLDEAQGTAAKRARGTAGAERHQENLRQGLAKARNLMKRARKLGVELPQGDGGEGARSIPA